MLTLSLDFGLENIRFVSFNTLDVVLASGGIIKGGPDVVQTKEGKHV